MDDRFEEDVLALQNYSFIKINADGTTFEMHGLVWLAMRNTVSYAGVAWTLQAKGEVEKAFYQKP